MPPSSLRHFTSWMEHRSADHMPGAVENDQFPPPLCTAYPGPRADARLATSHQQLQCRPPRNARFPWARRGTQLVEMAPARQRITDWEQHHG
jgi:hypothetical protein